MVVEFLSYQDSELNPFLNLLFPCILAIAILYLLKAQQKASGEIKKSIIALIFVAISGIIAGAFRYYADITETQYKWGESIFFLVFVLTSIFAALYLQNMFMKMEDKFFKALQEGDPNER